MNKLLPVLVITLLFAMSFGAVGFTLMDHSNMQTCPISAMSGNDCASVTDKAIFALHHIEAFQQFTQATISYGIIVLSLLMLAGVFLIRKSLYTPQEDTLQDQLIHILKERANLPLVPPHILKWIALHNKRGMDSDVLVGGL